MLLQEKIRKLNDILHAILLLVFEFNNVNTFKKIGLMKRIFKLLKEHNSLCDSHFLKVLLDIRIVNIFNTKIFILNTKQYELLKRNNKNYIDRGDVLFDVGIKHNKYTVYK